MTASDALHAAPSPLDAASTVQALASSAVVRWWQTTAFLRVAGPDAASLLDGLCTQAVERIQPGHATLGLFLDAKAKVIAPAILHRTADEAWGDPRTAKSHPDSPVLLLETLPHLVEPLRAHLTRYRLRAKSSIDAVERATVAIVGADAPTADVEAWRDLDGSWTTVLGQSHPTRAFIGSDADCARIVCHLAPAAGLALADADALESARIEAGVAGLHDLLPGRMPAEVGGMDTAVALDAGCYLGQEPVARLHYRGHANRTLRRLVADSGIEPSTELDDPEAALALLREGDPDDARPIGRLTTWASRPDGTVVALGMVRREATEHQPLRLAGTAQVVRPVDAAAG